MLRKRFIDTQNEVLSCEIEEAKDTKHFLNDESHMTEIQLNIVFFLPAKFSISNYLSDTYCTQKVTYTCYIKSLMTTLGHLQTVLSSFS